QERACCEVVVTAVLYIGCRPVRGGSECGRVRAARHQVLDHSELRSVVADGCKRGPQGAQRASRIVWAVAQGSRLGQREDADARHDRDSDGGEEHDGTDKSSGGPHSSVTSASQARILRQAVASWCSDLSRPTVTLPTTSLP